MMLVLMPLVYHVRHLHPDLVQDRYRLSMTAPQHLLDVRLIAGKEISDVDGMECHVISSSPSFLTTTT